MRSEVLHYEADGLSMVSHFYVDDTIAGKRPGILVFPEAFGLGDHAKERAKRLAELGYAALACDLHGDGKLFPLDEAIQLITPLMGDPTRTRARAQAGLDALCAQAEVDPARIAAMGYCFGGTMSLELARSGAPIAGSIGFHSGLGTAVPDASAITGRVLVFIGADDPAIDSAQRTAFEQEMTAGGADWQMTVYGGVVHSFTNPAADRVGNPDFARYDAKADARSWRELLGFFEEIFGKGA